MGRRFWIGGGWLLVAWLVLAPALGEPASGAHDDHAATPTREAPPGATAAPATEAPSAGETPALIAAYAAALNAHDIDAVVDLYASDAVVVQAVAGGLTFAGPAGIGGLIRGNLTGLPDLTVTTEQVVASGDRIAWAWVYHGTYSGKFPSLPAGHGQPITLRGVSLMTVAAGEIVQETRYFDNLTFLDQADAAATPSGHDH